MALWVFVYLGTTPAGSPAAVLTDHRRLALNPRPAKSRAQSARSGGPHFVTVSFFAADADGPKVTLPA
jgi:hypothetical protein